MNKHSRKTIPRKKRPTARHAYIIKPARAMKAAIAVWRKANLWQTEGEPLHAPKAALRRVCAAAAEVRAAQHGRRAHANATPMDWIAPSAGHAACFLLDLNFRGRIRRSHTGSLADWRQHGGTRFIYRGQSVPWPITPRLWRSPIDLSLALQAMRAYLAMPDELDEIADPGFQLLGLMNGEHDMMALAQHYGLPTSLVDFTFNPFTALRFALGRHAAGSCSADGCPPGHAVVFSTTLYHASVHGKPLWRFPNLAARRLYLQSGFFIDYGASPEQFRAPLLPDATWESMEGACHRIFFPRQYPSAKHFGIPSAEALLATDHLFLGLVEAADLFAKSGLPMDDGAAVFIETHLQSYLEQAKVTRTGVPWRQELRYSTRYSMDESLHLGRMLDRYMRAAALIETANGPVLDPLFIAHLSSTHPEVLSAVSRLHELPGYAGKQFGWLWHEIQRAAQVTMQFHRARTPPGNDETVDRPPFS